MLKIICCCLLLLQLSLPAIWGQDMVQHQWENRILVIQFDEKDQTNYTQQIDLLKTHKKELTERKLVIYQICDDLYKVGLDENSTWQSVDNKTLNQINQAKESNFYILLIGLDGGIKLRKQTVLSMTELFGIIDAMPMRVRELSNKKSKK